MRGESFSGTAVPSSRFLFLGTTLLASFFAEAVIFLCLHQRLLSGLGESATVREEE